MTEENLLRSIALPNGLELKIMDISHHYFGGYWQVALEASCCIKVSRDLFESDDSYLEACRLLGDQAQFSRKIEQMAVHQDQLEQVKSELLARFEENMLPYLGGADFSKRFVQSEYTKQLKKPRAGFRAVR